MKMKKLLIRTWIGVKKGILTPTLSKEMLDFQRKPVIRIIRVLGGLSFLSLLGRGFFDLHGIYLYFSYFFAIIFFIYHIYISIHKYKHIKLMLKSDELDIRNSPLDRYASMLVRLFYCGKGMCESAAPIGLGLGLMLGADQVLKDGGREPFFGPLLGGALNKAFPKSELDHWKDSYLQATKRLSNAAKEEEAIADLMQKTQELDVSGEDKKELFSLLTNLKKFNELDLEKAKEQALKTLENKPK